MPDTPAEVPLEKPRDPLESSGELRSGRCVDRADLVEFDEEIGEMGDEVALRRSDRKRPREHVARGGDQNRDRENARDVERIAHACHDK